MNNLPVDVMKIFQTVYHVVIYGVFEMTCSKQPLSKMSHLEPTEMNRMLHLLMTSLIQWPIGPRCLCTDDQTRIALKLTHSQLFVL